MEVEHAIEINRSREEIFSFLSTHSNHVKFIEENESCEQVTPGPMALGTRVKNVAKVFGMRMTEQFEIVAFEPPSVLGKASREGSSFETTDRFELTPSGAGTRVRLVVTATARTFGDKIVIFIMEPVLRRSLKKMLANLKGILEQNPA